MGRKHKSFSDKDGERGELRELKRKIQRLESDKRKLISELGTLKKAFDKTQVFLTKKVEHISVEDLTNLCDRSLQQIEDITKCKSCSGMKFNYLKIYNGNTIKICNECKHRETTNDSSELNCIEEII